MVFHSTEELNITVSEQPRIPLPRRVLLTTPSHYEVAYVINPHMKGHVGTVDAEAAHRAWSDLGNTYAAFGIEPVEVAGQPGLPDMVFCANQTLPFCTPSGDRGVVLSRMHTPQRRPEVFHYRAFFEAQGYDILSLAGDVDFEGMGDAIWHPGRYLLWGGYGVRTDAAAYEMLADRLNVHILALRLVDEAFYHLDTCFCALDERTALIFPEAFDAAGRALIHDCFDRVLEAPEQEARSLLACNAHCPDGRHVLIQRGAEATNRLLCAAGFQPIEVETDEFLKAGGSVFCMKQMFW